MADIKIDSGHKAEFLDVEGASSEEWREAMKSEVKDYLLPVYAGEKAPTRLDGDTVHNVSWKMMKRDADRKAWSYKNKNGKERYLDLDKNGVRGYGFAVRLGDFLAIDCDIEDKETSDNILQCLLDATGKESVPRRIRENSNRWACLVAIDDLKPPFPNDAGEVEGKGEVELKGCETLLVCAGYHKSGVNYRWVDGPCCSVIHLSSDQMTKFLGLCEKKVKMSWHKGEKTKEVSSLLCHQEGDCIATFNADFDVASDSLARWLIDHGYISSRSGNKLNLASCPWSAEHSTNTDGTATTTYFASIDGLGAGFHCFHAHCSGRTVVDLMKWAESNGWESPEKVKAKEKERAWQRLYGQESAVDPIPSIDGITPCQQTPEDREAEFKAALKDFHTLYDKVTFSTDQETGEITVHKELVCDTDTLEAFLKAPKLLGFEIYEDTFFGEIRIKEPGKPPTTWDEFLTISRCKKQAEKVFNKNMLKMTAEMTRAFLTVAREQQIDSGVEAVKALPEWDGNEHLASLFVDIGGARPSPGAIALGFYQFRVAVARLECTDPNGVKADIIPVFYGEQGVGKSRFVRALSLLGPKGYTDEVRLDAEVPDIVRATMGKCIVEIPELGGLRGNRKTRDDIKALTTKSSDRMTQKYEKNARDYPRRAIWDMTTNEKLILSDPTGDRRFAPIELAELKDIDFDRLKEELPQCYAQAKYLNDLHGGVRDAQEALERCLPQLQEGYHDELINYDRIAEWVYRHDQKRFTANDVAEFCLEIEPKNIKNQDKRAITDVLRKLGCDHNGKGYLAPQYLTSKRTTKAKATAENPTTETNPLPAPQPVQESLPATQSVTKPQEVEGKEDQLSRIRAALVSDGFETEIIEEILTDCSSENDRLKRILHKDEIQALIMRCYYKRGGAQ